MISYAVLRPLIERVSALVSHDSGDASHALNQKKKEILSIWEQTNQIRSAKVVREFVELLRQMGLEEFTKIADEVENKINEQDGRRISMQFTSLRDKLVEQKIRLFDNYCDLEILKQTAETHGTEVQTILENTEQQYNAVKTILNKTEQYHSAALRISRTSDPALLRNTRGGVFDQKKFVAKLQEMIPKLNTTLEETPERLKQVRETRYIILRGELETLKGFDKDTSMTQILDELKEKLNNPQITDELDELLEELQEMFDKVKEKLRKRGIFNAVLRPFRKKPAPIPCHLKP